MFKDLPRAAVTRMVATASLLVPLWVVAQTPAPPSLQEQLEAQYQVARMSTANGCTLTTPGTALTLQKPGVFAVPSASVVGCPTKYEEGKVKSPNVFCKALVKQNASSFQAGQTVYPLKIEVNPKQEKVSFSIASCDQGLSWKAEVVFQFAKDYLEKAGVTDVEDKISELLALAGDNSQQAQAGAPPAGQDQSQPQPQPPPGDQASAQPPPVTIQIGQSLQDVEGALGQPEKKVNLGAKQIYVYKDLKITFVDGKVSDVQ
jgi:hypothetical protein